MNKTEQDLKSFEAVRISAPRFVEYLERFCAYLCDLRSIKDLSQAGSRLEVAELLKKHVIDPIKVAEAPQGSNPNEYV